MLIQDAIRSGKKFRRKNHICPWLYVKDIYIWAEGLDPKTKQPGIMVHDILADDWEIEEDKRMFTEEECVAALEKTEALFSPSLMAYLNIGKKQTTKTEVFKEFLLNK